MRKSQLFTLDLMLALIPLTIVLGLSASAISGLSTQVQSYAHWYSMHRQVNDASEALIKTAGEPPDWNASYPASGPSLLGLANYTGGVEPYMLDSNKLAALNATVGGQPLHQLAIPKLFGGANLSYYNLSFRGAEVNTTNLTMSFSYGSRARASDVYATQRLALMEMEKQVDVLDNVSRTLEGNPCDGEADGAPPPTYYMSFYVGDEDTGTYDYWLIGKRHVDDNANADAYISNEDEGNATDCGWAISGSADYYIYPIPGGTPTCGCPATGNCREDTATFNIHKIRINSDLVEGKTNYVFIELTGVPWTETSYYVLRVPEGTCNVVVKPELADFKAVECTLEVGL